MSGTALNKDTQCRSLGFVNNPARGYFRTVKTCHDGPKRAKPTAFGLIIAPDVHTPSDVSPALPESSPPGEVHVDRTTAHCNLKSVEQLDVGKFKITWKAGTFAKPPVIQMTPCESFILENLEEDPPSSAEFPSEQAVVLCQKNTKDSTIVMVGRNTTAQEDFGAFIGPPVVRDDVSFYIFAIARQ